MGRLGLRNRLILFLVIIISVNGGIAFFSYTTANRYVEEFQQTLLSHYRVNNFRLELRNHQTALAILLRGQREPNFRKARADSAARLEFLIDTIAVESNSSKEAWFEIQALQNALDFYLAKTDDAAAGYIAEDDDYYRSFHSAEVVYQYMEKYISDLQNIRLSEGWRFYFQRSRQSDLLRRVITVLLILVVAVSLRFAFSFSRSFTEPISDLARLSSRIASGELDVPILTLKDHELDELGILTESFNIMSMSVRKHVEDIEQKALLEKKLHDKELQEESTLRTLREAQLINLETQIKPHFFFNTLNTIARQAKLEGATETTQLIHSLSNLFRYSMVSHQQTVSLAQEMAMLHEYFELQRRRFGDRITFTLNSTVNAAAIQVPPLIVQPFAENALSHGLEPLIGGGKLLVDVRSRNRRVRIRIADSGAGMSKIVRDSLLARDGTVMDGSTNRIGIRNVLTRLKLYYGSDARVSIISREGRGTLAVISIPYERRA